MRPSGTKSSDRNSGIDGSVLIRGGKVVDGTGKPGWPADVLVVDGAIAEIGQIENCPAGTLVHEARGAVVAPGFIDAHSHDDAVILYGGGSLAKLSQGITSVVVGNCGISLAPWVPTSRCHLPPPPLNLLGAPDRFAYPDFGSYLAALRQSPFPMNRAAVLGGHSALRAARVVDLGRPAGHDELAAMVKDLEEGMEAGLAGLSAGLAYPASIAADVPELVALARVAFRRGKVFAIHIRNEYDGLWTALEEAFMIARQALSPSPQAGARLVLSHQKCAGPSNRGRASELLARIDEASRDIPLAFDAYPYEAGSTLLEFESVHASRRVLITWSLPHPELAGIELAEAAERLGLSIDEAVAGLSPAGAAYFHMDEADVDAILAHPLCMVGSDGLPNDCMPHPRLYGAFPRYFARFVREKRLLSLEEAVRKASSLTASVFGLGCGLLVPGAAADITVFRPKEIEAMADWSDPRRTATGIDLVLLGGHRVWPQ